MASPYPTPCERFCCRHELYVGISGLRLRDILSITLTRHVLDLSVCWRGVSLICLWSVELDTKKTSVRAWTHALTCLSPENASSRHTQQEGKSRICMQSDRTHTHYSPLLDTHNHTRPPQTGQSAGRAAKYTISVNHHHDRHIRCRHIV